MDNNIPKCSKEMDSICLNNTLCYLCDGQRLYKRPKWMDIKDRDTKRKTEGIRKKPKEGMDFEKRVQKARIKGSSKKYNTPNNTGNIASRRPNSGAIWSMPGDIVTKDELIECKERGSKTAKGEKTITIQRQQLEKIKAEAYMARKDVWYYVFGFKECENIYVTKDFEDELRMIQQIEDLKLRIIEIEEKQKESQDAES